MGPTLTVNFSHYTASAYKGDDSEGLVVDNVPLLSGGEGGGEEEEVGVRRDPWSGEQWRVR